MKGLFDKPEEFTTLASFYLYKKNPAMSAKVLENALSEDQILFDTKNAKLLSDAGSLVLMDENLFDGYSLAEKIYKILDCFVKRIS